jgi:DNA modification methylase
LSQHFLDGRMSIRVIQGDVRAELPKLPSNHFDCIVTSPPYYGLRDYGCEGQIGMEPTLGEWLETMVSVCRELRRVLKPSGVFFCNIGDSYNAPHGPLYLKGKQASNGGTVTAAVKPASGVKVKDLMLAPERLAIALQADGWWVRSRIVWHKPNPMPESATDRPTSAHETIWMLTKSARYFWDAEAVREDCSDTSHGSPNINPGLKQALLGANRNRSLGKWTPEDKASGRNMRNVWTIATHPFSGAHFATFPPALVERCVKAGCPVGGHVLDPFGGSGTVGLVADRLGRDCTLIDLNTRYIDMAMRRIRDDAPLFTEVTA